MTCSDCTGETTEPFTAFLCLRCSAPLVACVHCVARLVAKLRGQLGDRARRAITEQTLSAAVRGGLEARHAC